jgi:phospholipase/carboxylesterase
MTSYPNAVVVQPSRSAEASVIWLHGLGADGHDFEPIVPHLGPEITERTRFVFPHAPERPVTINGGYVMRAWYDVVDADIARRADADGVRESEKILHGYIEGEIADGIPPERIVVAGFSQGGAIALHGGLRYRQRLAGVLGMSCYLPLLTAIADGPTLANATTPMFMAHGTQDPVIPVQAGKQSYDHLKSLDYDIEWHTYPIPHSVCLEEIEDAARWLLRVLG